MLNVLIGEIIKEEVGYFINEFYEENESSIADKWYEKNLGFSRERKKEDYDSSDGKYIGSITEKPLGGGYLKPPKVFKNPKSLKNAGLNARGLLLENGDFYLMMGSSEGLHDDLIVFLMDKNILPSSVTRDYPKQMPKEYIAVERYSYENIFLPSMIYDHIPDYYLKTFELANKKHRSYNFSQSLYSQEEVEEQLDMNRSYSYHPRGLDPNRNFGRGF